MKKEKLIHCILCNNFAGTREELKKHNTNHHKLNQEPIKIKSNNDWAIPLIEKEDKVSD